MVILEILNSPDPDVIGEIETFRSSFSIGRSRKSDIIIADPEIHPIHLLFSFSINGLHVHNTDPLFYYHSNGKKISGEKILKKDDQIKIGQTTILIKNISIPEFIANHKSASDLYAKAAEENPDLYNLLTAIEEKIVALKRDRNVQK